MRAPGSPPLTQAGGQTADLLQTDRSEDLLWLAQLTQAIAKIALEAGSIVMQAYEAGVAIRRKPDQSPVCDADEQSEALILSALQRLYPHIPVIAEETASCGDLPNAQRDFFLVDPLDGTQEFAQRNGEFSINIAFVRDARALCGTIFAPSQNRLWMASPGTGYEATVAAGQALPKLELLRRLHPRHADIHHLRALTSRSNLNAETESFLKKCPDVQRHGMGSALKFGLIASGEADFYPRFGPTMEWDSAAGDAILRAAGGGIVTQSGEDLLYGKADQAYRNPHFIALGDLHLAEFFKLSPLS